MFAFVDLRDLMTQICRSCALYGPSPPTCHLPILSRKIYAFQRVIPAVNCKSPSKMVNTALLPNKLQYSQCKLLVKSKYRCQLSNTHCQIFVIFALFSSLQIHSAAMWNTYFVSHYILRYCSTCNKHDTMPEEIKTLHLCT